jgi:quercetin dioxygenase-like cupin family protein
MARAVVFVVLQVLALIAALLGERVLAHQGAADDQLPGVVVETLGQSPVVGEGDDDLVLLRVTIEPGASIPASDGPRAAVVVLEEGRVGVALERAAGEASLTLAGGKGTGPLAPGDETILAPGDAISFGEGARLALRNAGDGEATLLYAAVAAAGDPLSSSFPQDASGTFSVETFACPQGMSIATLDTEACERSAESLIEWSLASDQLDAPLGIDEAAVSGATTTWQGLPSGTYFVDLTAESFATGYGDYFIPSSNQVTRQDERTTRIYYDASRSRESINAYVFVGDPATP